MNRIFTACMAAALAAAAGAAAAGSVEVSFVEPAGYADAGNSRMDEESTRHQLEQYLQVLGARYLAPDQSLRIEVLDIDLAGTKEPTRRGDLRIVRGKADVPRIKLRYTLSTTGKQGQQAEEQLTDLDYSRHLWDATAEEPLRYEKHMLEQWFRQRFGSR